MFLNSGQYYNSAALYGGGGGDYTGEYFGGFAPPDPYPDSRGAIMNLGKSLYLTKDIGLTDRDKLSLEYSVSSGKTTAGDIYGAIGALYCFDSLRRTVMLTKSPSRRQDAQDLIYAIRMMLPPFGKGGDKGWTFAWTKINRMFHPKLRAPKIVRKYIRDPDAQWKKGTWARYLRKVPALAPEKRQAMRNRFKEIRSKSNPNALRDWKRFYGPKGNHRAPSGDLVAIAQQISRSAPPASVPTVPLPGPDTSLGVPASASSTGAPSPLPPATVSATAAAPATTITDTIPEETVYPTAFSHQTFDDILNKYTEDTVNGYNMGPEQWLENRLEEVLPEVTISNKAQKTRVANAMRVNTGMPPAAWDEYKEDEMDERG